MRHYEPVIRSNDCTLYDPESMTSILVKGEWADVGDTIECPSCQSSGQAHAASGRVYTAGSAEADGYFVGYVRGRQKTYDDIREVLDALALDTHAADCSCQPCEIIREVLDRGKRKGPEPEEWATI